MTSDSS